MQTLRLISTFYKNFAFASNIISAICLLLIYKYGIGAFTILFWFKIITLSIILFFINNYKDNEFYYYQSLGLSKKTLWIYTISIDLLIFVSTITIMQQIV